MNHFEEAKRIWKERVPPSGQAETVEGELLRAVEKLRDEAIRNGNGNWDQGFEILRSFLAERLLDPAVFSTDEIARTSGVLERLKDHDDPLLDDEPYDELGDRVVEFLRHYGSMPHDRNPDLYR